MKAREQFTAGQKKQLSAVIRQQVAVENERYERDYDTLILYVLHTEFGFGRGRLLRFFREMVVARKNLKAFYTADDANETNSDPTIDIFAMRKRLTEQGLDPDILLNSIYSEIDSVMQEGEIL